MDRDPVTWQGMTEEAALESLLCGASLGDDRRGDLMKATEVIKDRVEWDSLRYKVILHALHAELGTWDRVAAAVNKPTQTVHNWAHRS